MRKAIPVMALVATAAVLALAGMALAQTPAPVVPAAPMGEFVAAPAPPAWAKDLRQEVQDAQTWARWACILSGLSLVVDTPDDVSFTSWTVL